MRRIAPIALAAALACTSEISSVPSGPRDTYYFPTAVAVHDHNVIVASSNSDLRYDPESGGTLIAVDGQLDPTSARPPLVGTVHIQSFSGELAIADAAAGCSGIAPTAIVPVRGANLLYQIPITDGAGPNDYLQFRLPLSLTNGQFADPYAVAVACGPQPGFARAYVGYLRSTLGVAWLTQVDLTAPDLTADGAVQHATYDSGQVRSFAYDKDRQRLYLVRTATGTNSPTLRWIDIVPDPNVVCDKPPCYCRLDRLPFEGGCLSGTSATTALAQGLELRAIALSTSNVPFRRAYMTARVFDPAAIPRIDYDGLLIVADLADDALGQLDLRVVREIHIGLGVSEVRVLPSRGAGRGDVVAAIGGGRLWIYDDETGNVTSTGTVIGIDPNGQPYDTGHPVVGTTPFALAVDPDGTSGTAHVYVGAYDDSTVKQFDIPLANPTAAQPTVVRTLIGGQL